MSKEVQKLYLMTKKNNDELTIVLPTKIEKYIVFLDSLKKQDYNDYIIYLADGVQ